MNPSRRRKKRPNYGIRTVEVIRGPNGFGFTISGQQPCILSCIVNNSPADLAGLRAGDFLISVNGVSVSKITHDAIVNLIGNSIGPIKMTVADNYYSDSSDEELDCHRISNSRKPKYMHKPRTRVPKTDLRRAAVETNEKNIQKMRECYSKQVNNEPRNVYVEKGLDESVNMSNVVPLDHAGGPIEYKAIVGYMGTIEMPKELLPSSRLQTVCNCIKKLRQEKRRATAVLMTILPTCLTLKNASNHILAIYPTNRVVYIGSVTDRESRYFGLVTSAVCERRNDNYSEADNDDNRNGNSKKQNVENCVEISNSCHVFVTDPKIVDHSTHQKKAEKFNFTCTKDAITGNCLEFPSSALYVVSLVQSLYKLHNNEKINEPVIANSPQPSASSNSDSGIGYRDDCCNISDRILVVEFPTHNSVPYLKSGNRPSGIDASNIVLEGLDTSLNKNAQMFGINNGCQYGLSKGDLRNINSKQMCNINNSRGCEKASLRNPKEHDLHDDDMIIYSGIINKKLNKAASVESFDDQKSLDIKYPGTFLERPVDVPDISPTKKSCESISVHSVSDNLDFKNSVDNISVHSSKSMEFSNILHLFKVPFEKKSKQHLKINSCNNLDGLSKSICNSEEILNTDGFHKVIYGSLQDLCSWSEQCQNPRDIAAQSEPDVRNARHDNDLPAECSHPLSGRILQYVPRDGNRMGTSLVVAMRPPFRRSNTSLRRTGSHRYSRRPTSLLAPPDVVPQSDQNGAKYGSTEGPASWACDFEKMLDDPMGLHVFAEFLKKEFSAENIYFWTACERYKNLPTGPEKTAEAQRIYQQHLCVGASEAVNVDAQGRQCTEQCLQEPTNDIFDQAQKQIFNLMKFDSYPRFLKSDIYKQCLSGNFQKPPTDSKLLLHASCTTPSKLKKSVSNAEDRRRKSLLPWHRKNRSKSKDRGELEYAHKHSDNDIETDYNENPNEKSKIHSNGSSLTSLDLATAFQESNRQKGNKEDLTLIGERTALCKVVLSNQSTTVVQIKDSETIHDLVSRVLEKRGFSYKCFEVYTDKHSKALDVNESATQLSGCEVTVEQRVVFKVDLPNRKTISIKSKYTKKIIDVLRPSLHKYQFNIDQVLILSGNNPVDLHLPVTSIDGLRLNVQLKEDAQHENGTRTDNKINKRDELTNKVFEGILQEKANTVCFKPTKSDKGSVKSEDWGSEHSSTFMGKLLRRDSGIHEKRKKALQRVKMNSDDANANLPQMKKPLIAKWKTGANKLNISCIENDELVEGLTRAQRRLEDQRGTEINFELPDFLKDKENHSENQQKQWESKSETRFYLEPPSSVHCREGPNSSKNYSQTDLHSVYENRNIIVPEQKNLTETSPFKSNLVVTSSSENSSAHSSPVKGLNNTVIETKTPGTPTEPPPLPPKPKIIPMRPPNWGQFGYNKFKDIKNTSRNQAMFLEQPSSSFV